jgi:hypothetical protein
MNIVEISFVLIGLFLTRVASQGRHRAHWGVYETEDCHRGRHGQRGYGRSADCERRRLLAEPLLSPSRMRRNTSLLASDALPLVAGPPALLVTPRSISSVGLRATRHEWPLKAAFTTSGSNTRTRRSCAPAVKVGSSARADILMVGRAHLVLLAHTLGGASCPLEGKMMRGACAG